MPEEEEKRSKQEVPKESSAISRREFLRDAGLIVGGATVGSMALISACGGTTTVTAPGGTATVTSTLPGATRTATVTTTLPGGTGVVTTTVTGPTVTKLVETQAPAPAVKYTVNGGKYELQVAPEDTLRDALRDQLGLISIKDMCLGYGACGSCSVIVDGRPILSCMALAVEYDGAVIETAEGIAKAKHPLINTYTLNYCMQCGYCTPGFVVSAKALLDHNPSPTEADIRDALGGNLCRCATYIQHIPAIQQAAQALKGGK